MGIKMDFLEEESSVNEYQVDTPLTHQMKVMHLVSSLLSFKRFSFIHSSRANKLYKSEEFSFPY